MNRRPSIVRNPAYDELYGLHVELRTLQYTSDPADAAGATPPMRAAVVTAMNFHAFRFVFISSLLVFWVLTIA